MEFETLDEYFEYYNFNMPEKHSDIKVAEREREMSSLQAVRIHLLRLEETIRLRDKYTSMGIEFYNKRVNDFTQWRAMQGSAALAHSYHFEESSKIPLFLKDYLKEAKCSLVNIDGVSKSKDLKLLWKLVDDYDQWIKDELEKMKGN